MSNNLKFRAWDLKLKKFTYFDLSCCLPIYGNEEEFIVNQSTRLTDINNNYIYEGDIIKTTKYFHENRSVYWSFELSGFCVTESINLEHGGKLNYLTIMNVKQWGIEIIGNIFENPDLINEKSN